MSAGDQEGALDAALRLLEQGHISDNRDGDLRRLLRLARYEADHHAPLKVIALFYEATDSDPWYAMPGEAREVTLDIHLYQTSSIPNKGKWLTVHMHGGPTGHESFVIGDALRRGDLTRVGWVANGGTPGRYKRCFVPPEVMAGALEYWGLA